MYVSKIVRWTSKYGKDKQKIPVAQQKKKITTLVKSEILARTWRQKKWDQDVGADKTGKALSSGIQ